MSTSDPKYTLAIARVALEQIAALGLPADPASFAVWYAYSAAQNPDINRQLNDLLAGNARLSIADVQRVWDEHLSPVGPIARIEKLGADLAKEVDHIVDLIASAVVGVAAYQADLDDTQGKLARPADRDSIRAIVHDLVRSTKEMQERNQGLETGLRIAKQVIENLQKDMDEIRRESERDPLTSLANRKRFDQLLGRAVAEATATEVPFSVMLIDIDHFKQFNDSHGHQTGDDVLRLIARTLKESVNGKDVAARYGGDEFVMLLPDTDLVRATAMAEHVRAAIAGKIVRRRSTGEQLGQLTVSIGVAEFADGDDPEGVIARADALLYAAKGKGRNRVTWQEAGWEAKASVAQ